MPLSSYSSLKVRGSSFGVFTPLKNLRWRREDEERDEDKTNSAVHLTGMIESNYDEITDSFDAMDLKPELLRGR